MLIKINNQQYHLEWEYGFGKINHSGKEVRVERTTCKLQRPFLTQGDADVRNNRRILVATGNSYRSPDQKNFIKARGRKESLRNLIDNISDPNHLFLFSVDAMKEVIGSKKVYQRTKTKNELVLSTTPITNQIKKERAEVWNQFREQSNLNNSFVKKHNMAV